MYKEWISEPQTDVKFFEWEERGNLEKGDVMFEKIDLQQFFKSEINVHGKSIQNACTKLGTNDESIAQNFPVNGWSKSFIKFLSTSTNTTLQ